MSCAKRRTTQPKDPKQAGPGNGRSGSSSTGQELPAAYKFPSRFLLARAGMGSFDSVTAALRAAVTPLRMTVLLVLVKTCFDALVKVGRELGAYVQKLTFLKAQNHRRRKIQLRER